MNCTTLTRQLRCYCVLVQGHHIFITRNFFYCGYKSKLQNCLWELYILHKKIKIQKLDNWKICIQLNIHLTQINGWVLIVWNLSRILLILSIIHVLHLDTFIIFWVISYQWNNLKRILNRNQSTLFTPFTLCPWIPGYLY